jgi:protein-disulfide isomerase
VARTNEIKKEEIMKTKLVAQFLTLAIAMLIVSSSIQAQTADPATRTITSEQRETIETVVREYLFKNPSIIREVTEALQLREEKEKQLRASARLNELKTDIYSDLDSPSVGSPKGDVTVVVFFDYNCGYCKNTLPELQNLVKQDPSIRLIYKEYPILGPTSFIAARAALAANRQGKYEEFHQALMAAKNVDLDVIKAISARLRLNYIKLRKDMDDSQVTESLQRNLRLATSLEISGTPGYIIGDRIIPGAIDSVALTQLVSDARARLTTRNTAGVASSVSN